MGSDQFGNSRIVEAMGPQGQAVGATLSVTTTSGQTAAITGNYVDIVTDAACFVELGSSPTAVVNTSYYLVANAPHRFPITSGYKIAAITASGTANLYYHPVG